MKPRQLVTILILLAGLAACTAKTIETETYSPTPTESPTTATLAAPAQTATTVPSEAATEIPEGPENAEVCGGIAADGWKVFCNAELGYSFQYPADAVLETDADRPTNGVTLIGPIKDGEHWPWIEVRHPQNQAEYYPPSDVDLQQWLEDHYLLGAPQQADTQVAGTRAVHLRFDRSPQSYAFDRYYFARAGQLYLILIAHTGGREDWDVYNHFLESFKFGIGT